MTSTLNTRADVVSLPQICNLYHRGPHLLMISYTLKMLVFQNKRSRLLPQKRATTARTYEEHWYKTQMQDSPRYPKQRVWCQELRGRLFAFLAAVAYHTAWLFSMIYQLTFYCVEIHVLMRYPVRKPAVTCHLGPRRLDIFQSVTSHPARNHSFLISNYYPYATADFALANLNFYLKSYRTVI
jgi:hypothetical protein